MYKYTFRKITPTLVTAMLGYNLLSSDVAYAQSKSAEVSVSVTVVWPIEREVKIADSQSSNAQWERVAPETNYIADYI